MDGIILVKPLETLDEFRACHEVQKVAWQFPDLLIIPYTQLTSAQHNGGLVLGAFDGQNLIGFVFSYLGRGYLDCHGRRPIYLFSQRMGVLPAYQGQRIGERLKWAQRDWALEQGLEHIVWTYDPLESPNAHLNIAKLGGIVRRYEQDFYGRHDTFLHDHLPSDRFVLDWRIGNEPVLARLSPNWSTSAAQDVLLRAGRALNSVTWDGEQLPHSSPPDLDRDDPILLAEVPAHWQALRRADMSLAMDWRLKTRALFEHYFARDYAVSDYVSTPSTEGQRNYYVLEKLG